MIKLSIPNLGFSKLLKNLHRMFLKIPLFKELADCPEDAKKNARYEVLVTAIFSTAPFWLTAFISSFIRGYSGEDSFANGEVFIFTTAMFGSVIYVASKRYGETKLRFENEEEKNQDLTHRFPLSSSFTIVSALACLMCGIVFALLKTDVISGNPNVTLNYNAVRYWSIGLLIAVFCILYCVAAFKNKMDLLSKGNAKQVIGLQRIEENQFSAKFGEAVGG